MLGINEVKSGKCIVFDGEPYKVLHDEHSKTGRAGAVLRTKLKNLITGAVLDKTFQGADKLEEADISKSKAQYLYSDGDDYAFMDNESYEQFTLDKEVLSDIIGYLIEGTEVNLLNFNDDPINVELPIKMNLKVIDAPPGIKGDTASGGDKVVTLETGLKITAPLFINNDDVVVVNTEKGEYVSRA
ncbi:elongation factor P [Patescibacteria group bacterium]